MQAGYTNVFALKGGWHEWQARGYPTGDEIVIVQFGTDEEGARMGPPLDC